MCSGGGGDERCVISRLFSVAEDQSDVVGGKRANPLTRPRQILGWTLQATKNTERSLAKLQEGFHR